MKKYILFAITALLCGIISCNAQSKPAGEEQFTFQTQEMPLNLNGQNIFGLAYIPENVEGRLPVVIFSHGFSSTHMNGDSYARAMASRGYLVYAFDFRGGSTRSRSDGSTTQMSVFTEKSDLEGVLQMVRDWDKVDKDKVFLLGASQGGMVSAMVAAEHPDQIKGLMLLYPALVIPDDAHKRFGSLDQVPENSTLMGMPLGRTYYEGLFDYNVYEDIKRYPKHVLIIHGDKDELVPLSYSEKAEKEYPSAELKVIKGGDHGFKDEHLTEATGYILEYLSKRGK